MKVELIQQNGLGWITINRPEVLNAIDFETSTAIHASLDTCAQDHTTDGIILRGNGRAFCAGGDVRAAYGLLTEGRNDIIRQFFELEYNLIIKITDYPKPYISLLHGIVMGGGMGISVPGTYRVATPTMIMAMPETLIGFFPDVGAGYFLNQCPGHIGMYLALTGLSIDAASAQYCGLVTHIVPEETLQELQPDVSITDLLKRIEENALPSTPSLIQTQQPLIDQCFGADSLEEILQNLQASSDPFAQKALATLQRCSPYALQCTFDHMQVCRGLNMWQVMDKNRELVDDMAFHPDFQEGVRALLVDKDQQPKWQGLL